MVNALVKNQGLIVADNGQVQLTARGQDMLLSEAVNNTGIIRAQGISQQGGSIVLDGGDSGVVTQAGTVDVSSATGQGGSVTVEGQNIHLTTGSVINASGKSGGGQVYTGGGWQGKDVNITNADAVVMDSGAVIDVSATGTGNGGTAVLWSNNYTNFRGDILAQGGAAGGNGGNVETSSHNNLQAFGNVDAGAVNGSGGNWLLDPTDVTIVSNATVNNSDSGTGVWRPSGAGSQILNGSINSELNKGTSVTVLTNTTNTSGQYGNITLLADINKTGGGDATLSLIADGNINITNHNITSTSGALNVNLTAGKSAPWRGISINGSNITTNGGNIFVSSANVANSGVNVSINSSVLNAGGGNIQVVGSSGNGNNLAGIYASNSTLNGGNVSLTGSSSVMQGILLLGKMNMTANGMLNITGMSSGCGCTGISYDNYGTANFSGRNGVIISGSSDKWTGLFINATGSISSSNGSVWITGSGNASAGGKGVQLLGGSANRMNISAMNGNLSTTAAGGVVLSDVNANVAGMLITGNNTYTNVSIKSVSSGNNASAITISGKVDGANALISGNYLNTTGGRNETGVLLSNASLNGVTVNGSSVYMGTTGIFFSGTNTLNNTLINGYSESGTNAILVTGVLNNQNNVSINANANSSLSLGVSYATINGGYFNASSLTGSGFDIEGSVLNNTSVSGKSNSPWSYGGYFGGGSTLNNSTVTGNSASIGIAMWGNLKMLGNSSVTGNSVNSTGVDIIGAISGGVINGYSKNSYGIKMSGNQTTIGNVRMTAVTDSWAASAYPVDQQIADSALYNTVIVQSWKGLTATLNY
ncbi:TPA_asm: S-layer family protein [Salmonella enterica subsp. enterica serovar Java]|nr:S-layer family protein [Salmonella enterica subsp. enterica serovar Java]